MDRTIVGWTIGVAVVVLSLDVWFARNFVKEGVIFPVEADAYISDVFDETTSLHINWGNNYGGLDSLSASIVSHGSAPEPYDHKIQEVIFLKFDLTESKPWTEETVLNIFHKTSPNGVDDKVTECKFQLYVLTNGDDLWEEDEITWVAAPGWKPGRSFNDFSIIRVNQNAVLLTDIQVDTNGVSALYIPQDFNGNLKIKSLELRNYIRNDNDRSITLLLVRDGDYLGDGTPLIKGFEQRTWFASKEEPNLEEPAPNLVRKYFRRKGIYIGDYRIGMPLRLLDAIWGTKGKE